MFAGTGVRKGTTFGNLIGVEYDRVTPGFPVQRPIQVLSHSPLVCKGVDSFADSAYYTHQGGAGVFNCRHHALGRGVRAARLWLGSAAVGHPVHQAGDLQRADARSPTALPPPSTRRTTTWHSMHEARRRPVRARASRYRGQ